MTAVEDRLAAIEARHSEFEKVHVSRRGAEGARGERGEQGPVGPPADPNQVAAIAAELVAQKFRHAEQVARFERLLKQLEDQIASAETMVKAGLRFAVLSELRETGLIDSKGQPSPRLKGDKGDKGDTGEKGDPGEKGDKGDQGNAGRNGVDGRHGEKGDKGEQGVSGAQGPQGPQGLKGDKGEMDISNPSFRNAVAQVVLDMKARGSLGTPHGAIEPTAPVSRQELKELLQEIVKQQPSQPEEKKKGWFKS
jgi:hypothetical protein